MKYTFVLLCPQVLVAIDARPNIKIKAISHKQFVEFVGTHDVPGKPNIEQVRYVCGKILQSGN